MEIPYVTQPRRDTGLYNAKVGIWLFLASEVMLFGGLFASYIMLRVGAPEGTWPTDLLDVPIGTINTVVLILSSVTVVLAWSALKLKNFKQYRRFQAVTILCAVTFIVIKSFEYREKFTHYDVVLVTGERVDGHLKERGEDEQGEEYLVLSHPVSYPAVNGIAYRPEAVREQKKSGQIDADRRIAQSEVKLIKNWSPAANTYFAIYFTMTALHALHVIAGALVIAWIWGPGASLWKTDPERYINRVEVSGLFWHFVDLVWIFLFPVLYLL